MFKYVGVELFRSFKTEGGAGGLGAGLGEDGQGVGHSVKYL